MSLRTIALALTLLVLGCGGGTARSDEPTTAREKQRREAEAKGDVEVDGGSGQGAGWRYSGERNECFFVVGGRCFKTEAAACAAARCGKKKCEAQGGGPVTVSCAK